MASIKEIFETKVLPRPATQWGDAREERTLRLSAEVGPRRLFFGRFDMLNRHRSLSGHLIILIGCSATATCWFRKAFHLTQAQNGHATWPSAVKRRFGVSGQLWTQTVPT
ncbi:hypothetical protein DPX16_21262 [Anabarilius grahami]|uniref:Uncharacterized protein n=1 Tax=Anabarilius grahami TaxID=495550 RepID=A0A3N0XQD4_ANAGA|nr:hypothetical protein DPX16_21262 [Anabarilius grahami]